MTICGHSDITDDRATGVLAEQFEPASLDAGIRWVLDYPARRQALGHDVHQRGEKLWKPTRVAGSYAQRCTGRRWSVAETLFPLPTA